MREGIFETFFINILSPSNLNQIRCSIFKLSIYILIKIILYRCSSVTSVVLSVVAYVTSVVLSVVADVITYYADRQNA